MPFRITTWNVNGIRNPFGYHPWSDNRTFENMFNILESDIVIMQELKIQRKDLRDDMVLIPGWDCYFSLPKHKKGYSGVAIYTRTSKCAPIRAEEGVLGVLTGPGSSVAYRDLPEDQAIGGYMDDEELEALGVDPAALDAEGRCVVLEFPAFVIMGVYSPANSNGLRDDFRSAFLIALDTRLRKLSKAGKRVILTGDLNVSREEIDTAGAEDDKRKAGITHEEYMSTPNRRIFNQMLQDGDVFGARDPGREEPILWDSTRAFHKTRKGMFTHWEQKINARPGNFGSRIDFVLCSLSMASWATDANIQEGLMGSDHCPVYVQFADKVDTEDGQVNILDILNPPGLFVDGVKVGPDSLRKTPAFSGKLLPEFDRRLTVKDMFSKVKNQQAKTTSVSPSQSFSEINLESAPVNEDASQPLSPVKSQQSPKAAMNGSLKRKAPSQTPQPPSKRDRTSNGSNTEKGNEQKSVMDFFRPKTQPIDKKAAITATADLQDAMDVTAEELAQIEALEQKESLNQKTKSPEQKKNGIHEPEDPQAERDANIMSWSTLFSKPSVPRCESHNEPCTIYDTKKKGYNCGRKFYLCPRPIGPSGEKETGTQWRCKTFIWASDWNGGAKTGQISATTSPTKNAPKV